MPVFSRSAFRNNFDYHQLAKKEAAIIVEQFKAKNYEFALNVMFGNNKFTANGVPYEFHAFRFNAGKTDIGIRGCAAELMTSLFEVNRLIPLNIKEIGEVTERIVGMNDVYPGCDYHELTGRYLSQEELNEEIFKDFPSSPEDSVRIKIQNNIDAKNEKMEDRNNVDISNITSLGQLKTEMRVQYLSEFDEKAQNAYRHYLEESRNGTENGLDKTADREYVKGLNVAAEMGVDKDFMDKAITVIKNAQDDYKAMSGAGRFFSYLNPFPNKYRAARTHIADMINELSSNTDVGKEDLSNYIYGKTTEKPQPDLPSYEEIAEKDLAVQNELLNQKIESMVNNGDPAVTEDPLGRKAVLNLETDAKEESLEESPFIESVGKKEDAVSL